MLRTTWFCLLFVIACGDDSPPVDGGSDADADADAGAMTNTVATFAPPSSGTTPFLAVPFPNDLYLDETGHVDIDLTGYSALVRNSMIELRRRTGFCRICTITFPLSGMLDRASVPTDAPPDAEASIDDAIVLIRADGAGGPIPLQVDYHEVEARIVIRPRYGIVLEPETRYVAALTSDLLAADGSALEAAPAFAAIRDGGSAPDIGERVRMSVEDALTALEDAGVARARVVSATIFTTDGEWLLRELEGVSLAAPAPVITVDRVIPEAELDDFFGQPVEDRPGWDIASADGISNYATVHDAIGYLVLGHFSGPRVITGSGGEIGRLLYQPDGHLAAGPDPERIPFVLVVPRGVSLADIPVVLIHHGTPGHMTFAMHQGNTFARLGMASFGYNAFLMAERTSTVVDERNEIRDIDEPDGIPDTPRGPMQDYQMVGLAGAEPGFEDRYDHFLGMNAQILLDVTTALRLLAGAELSPITTADTGLADLSFDADRVFYMGQSFGGFVGMAVLPLLAGRVQAMVLSVGPPDPFEHQCNSPQNRPSAEDLVTIFLSAAPPFEPEKRLCMLPTVDLARWVVAPIAPVNNLHFALREPIIDDSPPPDLLFFYATHDRLVSTWPTEHALGVAGVPVEGTAHFASLPALTLPVSANFSTPTGTITAGGIIWEADHSLLRFKNVSVGYEVPIYPPFRELESSRAHVNPIERAHALMSHFFETRLSTGTGEILETTGG